MKALINAT